MPWILAALVSAACDRQEVAGPPPDELREAEYWARAERLRTPEAWQSYLGQWPDGRYAELARGRLVAFIPPERPAPDVGIVVGHVVQLGAWSTQDAARASLARSLERHPAELAGFELRIVAPQEAEGTLWRLRTGLLAEPAARELCGKLREAGVDCVTLTEASAGQPAP